MLRRNFCKATISAAVAATLPGCGSESQTDLGSLISAVSSNGEELSIEYSGAEKKPPKGTSYLSWSMRHSTRRICASVLITG